MRIFLIIILAILAMLDDGLAFFCIPLLAILGIGGRKKVTEIRYVEEREDDGPFQL
jgi:hypothetical protein